jgi:hypothetical protein
MPHRSALLRSVNDIFFHDLTDDQRKILESARDLRTILGETGVLRTVPEGTLEQIEEALGASAIAGVVAALKAAVSRGLPVNLQWIPNSHGMVEIYEAVAEDGVGMVGINVRMPWLEPIGAK